MGSGGRGFPLAPRAAVVGSYGPCTLLKKKNISDGMSAAGGESKLKCSSGRPPYLYFPPVRLSSFDFCSLLLSLVVCRPCHNVSVVLHPRPNPPGIIDDPGSFSGRFSSAQPTPGPRGQEPHVLRNLEQIGRLRLHRPGHLRHRGMRRQGLELVGRRDEGFPVRLAISAATFVANSGWVWSPIPTAVPPCARG